MKSHFEEFEILEKLEKSKSISAQTCKDLGFSLGKLIIV